MVRRTTGLSQSGSGAKLIAHPCLRGQPVMDKYDLGQVCYDNKQTLTLRQASEESACFLLLFFCDD